MATEYQSVVLALTVGVFDAAPGVEFLDQFNQRLVEGESRQDLVNFFTQTGVFKSLYPETISNSAFAESFIASLVGSSVNESSKNWATQWLENQLNGGASKAEVILAAIDTLQGTDFSDDNWGQASQLFAKKINAAATHTILAASTSGPLSELQKPLQNIALDDTSSSGEVILSVTFENRTTGEYSRSDYEKDLSGPGAIDHFRNGSGLTHEIVSYGGDQMLRVVLPQGEVQKGLQSYISLDEDYEALSLSFELVFETGFDWAAGGKLPGLSGVVGSVNATAGRTPDVYEGFSARSMYREDGKAEQYRYDESNAAQSDFYRLADDTYQFKANTHYQVEQHIVMNTPNVADGVILTWVNGQLVGGASDYLLRSSYDSGINKLLVDIWAGGAKDQFKPANDSYVLIDDINVKTLPDYDVYLNAAPELVETSQIELITKQTQKERALESVSGMADVFSILDEASQSGVGIQSNEIEITGSTTEFVDTLVE